MAENDPDLAAPTDADAVPPRTGLPSWARWAIASTAVLVIAGVTAAILTRGNGDANASPEPSPSASASPSNSASPSPSSSPSPSPTITIDANGRTLPGFVTVDPSLPDALPLPAGIWDQTGPGWVLATYRPSVSYYDFVGLAADEDMTKQVVYLVNPQGQRYQVLELDVNQPIRIESWLAGESSAIVRECGRWGCISGEGASRALDLRTGTTTLHGTPFQEGEVLLTLADGTRVWAGSVDPVGGTTIERDGAFTSVGGDWHAFFGDTSQPSPNGTYLPLLSFDSDAGNSSTMRTAILTLATGTVTPLPGLDAAGNCWSNFWRSDGLLRVTCYDTAIGTGGAYLVDPKTGNATATGTSETYPMVRHEFWTGSGTWAGMYLPDEYAADGYEHKVGVETDGTPREVPLVDDTGVMLAELKTRAAVDGKVYADGQRESGWLTGPLTVVVYDISMGSQVVLISAPPGGPTFGVSPDRDVSLWGVTSWVVAP